jgi:hypothetical protein
MRSLVRTFFLGLLFLAFIASTGVAQRGDDPCFMNPSSSQWYGTYIYNGGTRMSRPDGSGFLSRNFGPGSPSSECGIGVDFFRVFWQRTVNFAPGAYRFSVTVDGEVSVRVGGYGLISQSSQTPTTYTADVAIPAGNHQIQVEYYDNGGPASVSLSWSLVSNEGCLANVSADRWKGEYIALIAKRRRIASPKPVGVR